VSYNYFIIKFLKYKIFKFYTIRFLYDFKLIYYSDYYKLQNKDLYVTY